MTSHPTCCCTGDPWPQRESPYSVKAVSKDWNLAYAQDARCITLLSFFLLCWATGQAEVFRGRPRLWATISAHGDISHQGQHSPLWIDPPLVRSRRSKKKKKKKSQGVLIFLRMSLRIGMLFCFIILLFLFWVRSKLSFGTWRVTKLDAQLGIDKRLRSRFGLQTLQTKRDRAATIARTHAKPKRGIGRWWGFYSFFLTGKPRAVQYSIRIKKMKKKIIKRK